MEISHHSDHTKSRVYSINMAYCVVDLNQGTEVVFSGSPIKITLFIPLSLFPYPLDESNENSSHSSCGVLLCLLKDRQLHKLIGILLCRFVFSSSFTDLFNNLLMLIWTQGYLFYLLYTLGINTILLYWSYFSSFGHIASFQLASVSFWQFQSLWVCICFLLEHFFFMRQGHGWHFIMNFVFIRRGENRWNIHMYTEVCRKCWIQVKFFL